MTIDAVVADANVLLSAIVGNAALRIFTESTVDVHVSIFNANEVEEYLPRLSSKYSLPEPLVWMQWRLLPLTTHEPSSYARHLAAARRDLMDHDPDDAHSLALARTLGFPLWSNDDDLRGHGVTLFTTARLLARLGM